MMGLNMVHSDQGRRSYSVVVALLGTSILAGMPATVLAQVQTAAQTAPSPAQPATTAAETPVAAPVAEAPVAPVLIQTITVVGMQRLEPDTIRSYVKLRYGQPYSQVSADQALKDLYATELFSDVQIRNDAGNVVIEVKENPVINRIVLEGNKRIKEEKILPEIKLAPRQILTQNGDA
jgi:outer membrane protein insertion porin family